MEPKVVLGRGNWSSRWAPPNKRLKLAARVD